MYDKTKAQSGGTKYDAEKPSMDLLDTTALVEMARVLDYGKHKYNAHNWRAGIQWSRTVAAIMRHVTAFNNGEDVDPETGISHIAHAAVNCMFLLNFQQTHKELDDRYKAPQGLAQMEFPWADTLVPSSYSAQEFPAPGACIPFTESPRVMVWKRIRRTPDGGWTEVLPDGVDNRKPQAANGNTTTTDPSWTFRPFEGH